MKNELGLFEKKGQILVSSRLVAERFEKRHDNVLRDIRNIIEGMLKLEHTEQKEGLLKLEDTQRVFDYFIESKYIDGQNYQKYDEFLLTKKGFWLYVFSFQGNELLKMRYIERFEEMEELLRERQTTDWQITRQKGKLIRRQETDAIQQLIPYAIEQGSKNAMKLYMTYSKLVNQIVGLESGKRNEATFKQLMQVAMLEDMITNTIFEEMYKGVFYKEIYKLCKAKSEKLAELLYLDTRKIEVIKCKH